MRNFTRGGFALIAILAISTPVLADPISMPLGCQNGTREEPVPPTIIPGYTEVVPDIYHEAWIEDVPDIQHDGWVEVTPDILHEAYIEIVPDIDHPATTQYIPGIDKTRWEKDAAKFCWRKKTLFGGPGFDRFYKPGCLEPIDTRSMASNIGSAGKKLVIPGWTEVVPDIEHPAWTEDVPDIQHEDYVEVTPDIEHPAYTEVVEDIWHPEQVIDNPPLVIDTKTIKYKVITPKNTPPFFDVTFEYVTTDGQCHH